MSIPDYLLDLKQAAEAARAAYLAHQRPSNLPAWVTDLTEQRLLARFDAAVTEYDEAADDYLAGAGGLR